MRRVVLSALIASFGVLGLSGGLLAITGDTCGDPFVIPSLPYWQETTTVDFGADYDLGDGNTCTGHTTSGKDVVYRYAMPDTLDTICIILSVIIPQEIWDAAIYILTDCDNLVCVAGADDYGPGSAESFSYALAPGVTYYFVVDGRLASDEGKYKFAISDCFTGEDEGTFTISRTSLGLEVVPNISRNGAEISFTLEEESPVSVFITDIQGRVVKKLISSTLGAGLKRVTWNGRDASGSVVPQGIYAVQVMAGSRKAVSRVLLLK